MSERSIATCRRTDREMHIASGPINQLKSAEKGRESESRERREKKEERAERNVKSECVVGRSRERERGRGAIYRNEYKEICRLEDL